MTPTRSTATLDQLVINPLINPRHISGDTDDVSDIKAQILQNGFTDPLWVRLATDAPEMVYEVIDGSRRLAALTQLAAAGQWREAVPVDVFDVDDAQAQEMALAAHLLRAELSPADEAQAFHRLALGGMAAEVIAARYARSEKLVRQRIAIGALPAPLLAALRAGKMDVSAAQAFTLSPAADRQLEVFEVLAKHHNLYSHSIRQALTHSAVRADAREAKFVGAATYEAAGGSITRDLFSETAWFEDAALLTRMVEEKIDAATRSLKDEGWAFVEVLKDQGKLHRFQTEPSRGKRQTPSAEDQAEEARLTRELEQKQRRLREIEEIDGDTLTDAEADDLDKEAFAVADAIAEIQDRLKPMQAKPWSAAQIKRLGALIVFGYNEIAIYRGRARPGAKPHAAGPDTTANEGDEAGESGGSADDMGASCEVESGIATYSEALNARLRTTVRHAMKLALLKDKPALAARLGLATRVLEALGLMHDPFFWTCGDAMKDSAEGEAFTALKDEVLAPFISLLPLDLLPLDHEDGDDEFGTGGDDETILEEWPIPQALAILETLPPEHITRLEALLTAISFDPGWSLKSQDVRAAIDLVDPDMRAEGFAVDEAFLKGLNRNQLMAVALELDPLNPPVKMGKRPDMVAALLPLLDQWLPHPLRSSSYHGPGSFAWAERMQAGPTSAEVDAVVAADLIEDQQQEAMVAQEEAA